MFKQVMGISPLFWIKSISFAKRLGNDMEVGIDSFASVGTSENGETADATQSVAELLERIEQADRSGLDIFGIGEHHRHEFLDSANAVILAAAAARTERNGIELFVDGGMAQI